MAKLKASEKGIEVEIKKQLGTILSQQKIDRAFKKVGAEIIDISKKRTASGVDIFGRRFGSYTAKYDKYKRKYFKSTYKQNIVMTGSLLSDLVYIVKDTKQTLTKVSGTIIVTAQSEKNKSKIEGLFSSRGVASNGRSYAKSERMFLGLSVSGSNKTAEINQIASLLSRALGLSKKNIGVSNAK